MTIEFEDETNEQKTIEERIPFWKLRSKHGRDRLFSTPEDLLQAACEYFSSCDNRPWYKEDFIKSGVTAGDKVKLNTATPYTLSGLCLYLNASRSWWNAFKERLGEDKKELNDGASKADFLEVITRIDDIIYTQKFEGAAVGAFDARIISQDLGLINKIDHTTDGKEIKNIIQFGGKDVEI